MATGSDRGRRACAAQRQLEGCQPPPCCGWLERCTALLPSLAGVVVRHELRCSCPQLHNVDRLFDQEAGHRDSR